MVAPLAFCSPALNLLTTKPVYQGEFQIVLNQENNQSGLQLPFSPRTLLWQPLPV